MPKRAHQQRWSFRDEENEFAKPEGELPDDWHLRRPDNAPPDVPLTMSSAVVAVGIPLTAWLLTAAPFVASVYRWLEREGATNTFGAELLRYLEASAGANFAVGAVFVVPAVLWTLGRPLQVRDAVGLAVLSLIVFGAGNFFAWVLYSIT